MEYNSTQNSFVQLSKSVSNYDYANPQTDDYYDNSRKRKHDESGKTRSDDPASFNHDHFGATNRGTRRIGNASGEHDFGFKWINDFNKANEYDWDPNTQDELVETKLYDWDSPTQDKLSEIDDTGATRRDNIEATPHDSLEETRRNSLAASRRDIMKTQTHLIQTQTSEKTSKDSVAQGKPGHSLHTHTELGMRTDSQSTRQHDTAESIERNTVGKAHWISMALDKGWMNDWNEHFRKMRPKWTTTDNYKVPITHRDSDSSYTESTRGASKLKEGEKTRRTRIRTLFVLCLVLVVLVAIIVPTVVLVSFQDDGSKETLNKYTMETKLLNMNYTSEMADNKSTEYWNIAGPFCDEMNDKLQASSLEGNYQGCIVDSLTNGSVLITFSLIIESNKGSVPDKTSVAAAILHDAIKNDIGIVTIGTFEFHLDQLIVISVIIITSNPIIARAGYGKPCTTEGVGTGCVTSNAVCINGTCTCPPDKHHVTAAKDTCELNTATLPSITTPTTIPATTTKTKTTSTTVNTPNTTPKTTPTTTPTTIMTTTSPATTHTTSPATKRTTSLTKTLITSPNTKPTTSSTTTPTTSPTTTSTTSPTTATTTSLSTAPTTSPTTTPTTSPTTKPTTSPTTKPTTSSISTPTTSPATTTTTSLTITFTTSPTTKPTSSLTTTPTTSSTSTSTTSSITKSTTSLTTTSTTSSTSTPTTSTATTSTTSPTTKPIISSISTSTNSPTTTPTISPKTTPATLSTTTPTTSSTTMPTTTPNTTPSISITTTTTSSTTLSTTSPTTTPTTPRNTTHTTSPTTTTTTTPTTTPTTLTTTTTTLPTTIPTASPTTTPTISSTTSSTTSLTTTLTTSPTTTATTTGSISISATGSTSASTTYSTVIDTTTTPVPGTPYVNFVETIITVYIDDSVTVECNVRNIDGLSTILLTRGVGKVEVSMISDAGIADYINGISIISNFSFIGTTDGTIAVRISSAVCEDKGNYFCQAIGKDISPETNSTISIKRNPGIPTLRLPIKLVAGDKTQDGGDYLSCTADVGYPPGYVRLMYSLAKYSTEFRSFADTNLGTEGSTETPGDCSIIKSEHYHKIRFSQDWNDARFRCDVYNESEILHSSSAEQKLKFLENTCKQDGNGYYYHPYNCHDYIWCYGNGKLAVNSCFGGCPKIIDKVWGDCIGDCTSLCPAQ